MRIFRIANPTVIMSHGRCVGPYNAAGVYIQCRGEDVDWDFYHLLGIAADDAMCLAGVAPQEDGTGSMNTFDHSVFVSVDQAFEWFAGIEGSLVDAGFRFLEYEIKEKYVKIGATQSIADLRRARLIAITSLIELFV